jgi:hypothetical protein
MEADIDFGRYAPKPDQMLRHIEADPDRCFANKPSVVIPPILSRGHVEHD